jgi:magnesium chelatase family protein
MNDRPESQGSPSLFLAASLHHQLEPMLQRIEVWSTVAIPSFRVVGLPGPEIIESCERVRAAIVSSGFEFPRRRLLVNLSPAGIRKQGTGTDLAIALAVLMASDSNGTLNPGLIVASGELGLDGRVASAGKITRTCLAAIEAGASILILAAEDQCEALKALKLICEARQPGPGSPMGLPRLAFVESLHEARLALSDWRALRTPSFPPDESQPQPIPAGLLLPSEKLLRKLLAASAGAHSILLLGPRGTGKSAALRWLSFLREPLGAADRLSHALLQELTGERQSGPPVREVSQHARAEALIGTIAGASRGGQVVPGELALAHGGILIADEFLEWRRDAREALRDPMETGRVILQRGHQSVVFPARFTFAGTANPCPCGGVPPDSCRCSPRLRQAYLERLSGPILDRMDCLEWVGSTPARNALPSRSELEDLQLRVSRTRERLRQDWGDLPGRLSASRLEEIVACHPRLSELQSKWGSQDCSLRRRHREIRVALTLAALDGCQPGPRHFLDSRPAQIPGVSAVTPRPMSLTPSSAAP